MREAFDSWAWRRAISRMLSVMDSSCMGGYCISVLAPGVCIKAGYGLK
jgi:hypothetical protein